MTNWRKLALWTAAGLSVCALLGVLLAVGLFDRADIEATLRAPASEVLSREVQIGAISLQLFPVPSLRAKDIRVLNPTWAQDRHLLQVDDATARLSLLPLLGGQLVVSAVTLDGLRLNTEISADGKKNWLPDLVPADASNDRKTGNTTRFNPQRLTALRIRNAEVNHRSPAGRRSVRIDVLKAHAHRDWKDVQIDAHLTHAAYPLQINGQFDDLAQIGVKGAVSQGSLRFNWHQAELALTGKIPLESSLQGHVLQARLDAPSLNGLLGFFAIRHEPSAAFQAQADLRDADGAMLIEDLAINLGKLAVTGAAKVSFSGPRPQVEARLATERLDWVQALLDAGRPPLPPKPAGEIFRDNPLAWPLLLALQGSDGKLDLKINSLRLRSGIEVAAARAQMTFHDDRLNVTEFSAKLLGGSMTGDMQLDGHKEQVRLDLVASKISLERWLKKKKVRQMIHGGPMEIRADVSASGASFKELAASLNGPVTVRVGPAKIRSKSAQQTETLLTGLFPLFSSADADHVELECVNARLPFAAGRAVAEPIVGARSNASQLLTSGFIDLRRQTMDLRGRVRARSGVGLGVSMLTGDIKIDGKILHPDISLDPVGTPAALARIGAAVATGGASILATALWDAANSGADPCQVVLATEKKATPPRPSRRSTHRSTRAKIAAQ